MAEVTGMKYVENDLRKYYRNYMRHLTQIIGDELTESARNAINDFYGDYSPHIYRRHYYNLRDNGFRRYYSNRHGSITYVGGVEFTPNLMDDIYKGSTTQVMDSVLAGFHGFPYDISKKKNGELKHEPVGYGFYKVNGEVLHSKFGTPLAAIPRMEPSPLELVMKRRDEIVENLDIYQSRAEKLAKRGSYKLIF